MGCYYNQYHRRNTISWIFHQMNSKDGIDFAMLFTLRERPEDIRSGVVKGSR